MHEPGIIPARAGFTLGPHIRGSRTRDHPRSRGVYTTIRSLFSEFTGSSPLARGLRAEALVHGGDGRIIPARAGFTPTLSGTSSRQGGSSPLARGLLALGDGAAPAARIIPARAGFTATTGPPSTPGSDHPRSRGVYAAGLSDRQITMGSSPLARGLLALRRRDDDSLRVGLLVWWQFLRGFLGWCS